MRRHASTVSRANRHIDATCAATAASPRGIFDGVADYPPEALRHHWEGTVIADLTISPQGAPTNCRIVKSSGHKVLDDATCNLMMSRARFKPAMDEQGNPVEDTYRTPPITWAIH